MMTHISAGARYILDASAGGDPPEMPEMREMPACGAQGEPIEVATVDVVCAVEATGSADECARALGALRHSVTCPSCRGAIARVLADMVWARGGENVVDDEGKS